LVIRRRDRIVALSLWHRGHCDAHTHETRNADISASISLKGSTGAWRRANTNEVATDEELIEGLSLLLYRRIATLIFLPADAGQQPSLEMVNFDPAEAAHQPGSGGVNVVPIGWSRLKPKAL
jgi:hypothetical protein